MSTLTLKIATLYAACSPELGVVSYGRCQDEALNNLTDEIRDRQRSSLSAVVRLGRTKAEGERHNAELAREGNRYV